MKTINEWTDEIYAYLAEKYPDQWMSWSTFPKALMYLVTEAAEAMEAWRDDDPSHAGEELADIAIRTFHTARAIRVNLEEEIEKKMAKNWARPRHHGRKQV